MAVNTKKKPAKKTKAPRRNNDAAVVAALHRSQAVIEFQMDGTIVHANDNFLHTFGYTLDEIKGRHHSMFVDEQTRNSAEYRELWGRLNRGEHQIAEFKCKGKGGKDVWIQASYNPILDRAGRPVKVVKFATDVTVHVTARLRAAEHEIKQAEELKQRVEKILVTVHAIAHGDFSQEIPFLGDDAVGQMAKALNQAVVSVRHTLHNVRDVAYTVSSAAEKLTAASEEIASGAQEQASSLEETAASLEEITATIKQNTDSAQQARRLASNSKEVAEKGGQVVGSAVEAMAAINQSSKKIAEIITAIDEIAFQTNLLALNAAVEAARAGEQGRGFAVVAAEVRNLAQRSATAAKEIKSLIQDSVRKVDNGTDLVNRSGQTLTEIVTSVKRVTDIVTEIAAASREQSTGVDQVNKAVAQMDKVTQTNAGQTEMLSNTAQSLLSHSEQLQNLVCQFHLGDESPPAQQAPPTRRAPVAPTKNTSPKGRPAVRAPQRELVGPNGNGSRHELDDDRANGFEEF